MEKLELINDDLLLTLIIDENIDLAYLTDLSVEDLTLICQDAVIAAIESKADLFKILNFPAEKLALFSNENLLELLEDNYFSITEIDRANTQELAKLLSYSNLKKAFHEGYSLNKLLNLLKKDKWHISCLTADSLEDLVLDEAPQVPGLVLEYAQENEVDFEAISNSLCRSERNEFRLCLKNKFGEEESSYSY